jgi:uncharacterized protein (DUF433 family)
MQSVSPVTYPHVELDEQDVPIIAGTTMKVVELVMAQQAYGWSPQELHFQHPYLSMSQVYGALTYYWDHKAELDADIAERTAYVERARKEAPASLLAARLREQNKVD